MDTSIKDTDAYLEMQPEAVRFVLEKLRQTIKNTAPAATELISYGMPAFKYNGMLCYFAAFAKHCSLFINPAIIVKFQSELQDNKTSKGTIQFKIDKPLSTELVVKMIKEAIKRNDDAAEIKKLVAKTKKI